MCSHMVTFNCLTLSEYRHGNADGLLSSSEQWATCDIFLTYLLNYFCVKYELNMLHNADRREL